MVNQLLLASLSLKSAANRWLRICHSDRLGMLVILILACADGFREPPDLAAVNIGPEWSMVLVIRSVAGANDVAVAYVYFRGNGG